MRGEDVEARGGGVRLGWEVPQDERTAGVRVGAGGVEPVTGPGQGGGEAVGGEGDEVQAPVVHPPGGRRVVAVLLPIGVALARARDRISEGSSEPSQVQFACCQAVQNTTMTAPDWGTVPTWASAILTSGSLILGFYILLRDRRKEEKEEARKLVFSMNTPQAGAPHVIRVINVSDRPFLSVGMFNADQWRTDQHAGDDPEGPLLPGQSREYMHDGPGSSAVLAARFQDADGQNWVKVFDSHQLVRAPTDSVIARHFERRLAASIRRTDQVPLRVASPNRWNRVKHCLRYPWQ